MFSATEKERILNFKGIRQISILTITFLLILLIKPASAQLMNLHELPENEWALNFGYVYNNHPTIKECAQTHTGIVSVDYGYSDNLKISFIPSLARSHVGLSQLLLSPGFKLRFMHIGKTWHPAFGYFFRSDWGALTSRCSNIRVIDLLTTTSFSVFARFGPETIWSIKPFVGISQSAIRHIGFSTNDTIDFSSRGEVGAELEIAQNFSMLGSWEFVFNNFFTVFHISMNFHY